MLLKLANDEFDCDKQTKEWVTKCVTNTIRNHIVKFLKNYDENKKLSNIEVDFEKILPIFDERIISEIENIGINFNNFLCVKINHLVDILESEDELSPDLFVEYILYKMIRNSECNSKCEDILIKPLTDLLYSYGNSFKKVNNLESYVKENTMLSTNFNYLLGVQFPNYNSNVFKNYKFKVFDDFGFIMSISLIKDMHDYGFDEVDKIFSGVEVPINFYRK